MGDAVRLDTPAPRGALRSRRLLRLAGDDRLVEQIRRGSEAAFEVAFERHAPAILGFCRHMVGSPEEAEDAVQHTFAAAYSDLRRPGEREIALKPWLFTIARNRCLSILRTRRGLALETLGPATAGLAEQVEQRAELRQLVADVRDLPDEQRAALLLAEVGGMAHSEIASVLGCEVARVKALVYRARAGLLARREAREVPCEQIREQLSNLRGGSLRRTELRLHLRECQGCSDFREQVRRQRQLLSVALPVAPSLGLKSSVLTAVGIGGGAAAVGGTTAATGAGAIAKLAAVAAIAAGGVAVVEHQPAAPPSPGSPAAPGREQPAPQGVSRSAKGTERPTIVEERASGRPKTEPGRGRGAEPVRAGPQSGRGRGPVETPPGHTPVRRGPPAVKPGLGRSKPHPPEPAKPKHVASPPARPGRGQPSVPGGSKKPQPPANGRAAR